MRALCYLVRCFRSGYWHGYYRCGLRETLRHLRRPVLFCIGCAMAHS